MALDICAWKTKEVWGADGAGLVRKTGRGRMPGTSTKGQSKAGLKKRKKIG